MNEKTEKPLFRPLAFRELEENLGYADAVMEWLEVAVRHFNKEYTDSGEAHILELAETYKVYVHPIDFNSTCVKWAQFQILSVYQYLEMFLKQFQKEHPRNVRKRKEEEDLISYTIDAFNVRQPDIGVFECQILNYYHLVRNHLMHKIGSKQEDVHLKQLERLSKNKKDRYKSLSAPNKIDSLGFDDFILFSRIVKEFARRFCMLTTPTANEFASSLNNNSSLLKKLRATSQNTKRLKAKVKSYIHTEFGYTCEDELISDIITEMGLLA